MGFPFFGGKKVLIVSRTLSEMLLVCFLKAEKDEKDKSGKSPKIRNIPKQSQSPKKDIKGHKRTNRDGRVQIRKNPPFETPPWSAGPLKMNTEYLRFAPQVCICNGSYLELKEKSVFVMRDSLATFPEICLCYCYTLLLAARLSICNWS